MLKRNCLLLACASLAQLCAVAQTNSSIASPILGYFWSSSHALVAVEGISAAAAARVYSREAVQGDHVFMPPGQAYLWIERDGKAYIQLTLGTQLTAVPDAIAPADLAAFNSGGSAAVLYSKAAGKLQVVTGLPGSPSVAREIAAPSGDSISSIAISDDTSTILLAGGAGVYASAAAGAWKVIMPNQASAVAFAPNQSSALIAVKDQNQVYMVTDPAGAATVKALAGLAQGINAPAAVAGSMDGRQAIVLNGSRTQAVAIDLVSLQATTLQLGIAAADMQRGRDSTFLFLPRQGVSPWLLDTISGRAILSFAPEIPGAERSDAVPVAGRK